MTLVAENHTIRAHRATDYAKMPHCVSVNDIITTDNIIMKEEIVVKAFQGI